MKALFSTVVSTVKIAFSVLGSIHQISKLGSWDQIEGMVDYMNHKGIDISGPEKKDSTIYALSPLLENMPASLLNLAIEISVQNSRK
jgi:hypothetical protein